jgi:hypothetical protein
MPNGMQAKRAIRPSEKGPKPSRIRNSLPSVLPKPVEATDGHTVMTVVSETPGGETPAIDCIGMAGSGALSGSFGEESYRSGGRKEGARLGWENQLEPAQKKTHRGFDSPSGSTFIDCPEGQRQLFIPSLPGI